MTDKHCTRECVRCSTPFQVIRRRGPEPRYCSHRCANRASVERRAGQAVVNPRGSAPREPYPCEVCGQEYQRPTNKDGSFRRAKHAVCGSTCREIKNDGRQYWTPKVAPCARCHAPFMPATQHQKYCGADCRLASVNEAYLPAKALSRECTECGEVFFTHMPWAMVCGQQCRHQHKKKTDAYKISRRTRDSRRRARMRGAKAERIDPIKVFERDKWCCHLCGKSTPMRLRGTQDDRAPELEHIVSLADGGSHTWGNVACSCRKCNREKGAESRGQLGFDIA